MTFPTDTADRPVDIDPASPEAGAADLLGALHGLTVVDLDYEDGHGHDTDYEIVVCQGGRVRFTTLDDLCCTKIGIEFTFEAAGVVDRIEITDSQIAGSDTYYADTKLYSRDGVLLLTADIAINPGHCGKDADIDIEYLAD